MEPIVFNAIMTKEGATRWNKLRKSMSEYWTPPTQASRTEKALLGVGVAAPLGGIAGGMGLKGMGRGMQRMWDDPNIRRELQGYGIDQNSMNQAAELLSQGGTSFARQGIGVGLGSGAAGLAMRHRRLKNNMALRNRNRATAVGGGAATLAGGAGIGYMAS